MENVKRVYAAYSNNDNIRMISSSGGIFTSIAQQFINSNGVVYGVRMSDDCYYAKFSRVNTIEELDSLRGSKYLQAQIGDTYKNVKKDLLNGLNVLFTGTGCQINGLKCFLQKEYNNLFCVDVVCHGTPSPKLWKKYAKYKEEKSGSKINYVSFRNKDRYHWDGFEVKEIYKNNNEEYISRHIDPYFSLFVSNICLRPACYNCTAKYYKLSDLTIADFWGIDDVAPEMNDDKGISLVIVRTDKGMEVFNKIKSALLYKEVKYEQGVSKNASEYKSYEMPKHRDKFFKDMNTMSFYDLQKKWLANSLKTKIKKLIKRLLKINGGGVNEFKHSHEDYDLYLYYKEN